jgi:hypothetical protein
MNSMIGFGNTQQKIEGSLSNKTQGKGLGFKIHE